jgi:hypothetical protein
MKLFRTKKAAGEPAMQHEELAVRIATTIIRAQKSIANYLNGKTNKLSKKARILFIVAFSIAFAAINIYILISSNIKN